jgi:hypothetical protein
MLDKEHQDSELEKLTEAARQETEFDLSQVEEIEEL